MRAELAVGKPGRQQIVHQQRVPESLYGRICQTQRGYALTLHRPGPLELLQSLFGENRILRDGLDLEYAPVGLKPNFAECWQVMETLAKVEVVGVVDGGFGTQRLACLVILLDVGAFVVEVQRRDHAVGNDARAERGPEWLW
jgi:hypothetical protein